MSIGCHRAVQPQTAHAHCSAQAHTRDAADRDDIQVMYGSMTPLTCYTPLALRRKRQNADMQSVRIYNWDCITHTGGGGGLILK